MPVHDYEHMSYVTRYIFLVAKRIRHQRLTIDPMAEIYLSPGLMASWDNT